MTALFEENLDLHDPVEVHWSASTILAIFFAASLISAVFFGLGYSFGGADTSKHSVAVTSADTSSNSTGSVALQTPSNHAAAFSNPAVIAKAASKCQRTSCGCRSIDDSGRNPSSCRYEYDAPECSNC